MGLSLNDLLGLHSLTLLKGLTHAENDGRVSSGDGCPQLVAHAEGSITRELSKVQVLKITGK